MTLKDNPKLEERRHLKETLLWNDEAMDDFFILIIF